MHTHDLKCHAEQFDAIAVGLKNFEWRKDDRGYAVGDMLMLRRYDQRRAAYTGEFLMRRVDYVLRKGFGMPRGYVVLSLDVETPAMPVDPAAMHAIGRHLFKQLANDDLDTLRKLLKQSSELRRMFVVDEGQKLRDEILEEAARECEKVNGSYHPVKGHPYACYSNSGGGCALAIRDMKTVRPDMGPGPSGSDT